MSKNTSEQKTGGPSAQKDKGVDLKEEDLEKVEGAWGTILTDLGFAPGNPKKKTNPTDQSGH